jgi:hypothetical protein
VNVRAVLATAFIAGVLCGCGDSGEGEPTTTTTQPPQPAPRETVDKLPKLPPSWHPFVARRGGFAVGLPRGWKAKEQGPDALIRSFDRLVAISIAPDRSQAAIDVPLEDFATRTLEALPGLRGDLRRVQTRRYRHRYAGTEVRARATASNGVDQRLSVIVLRRDSVTTVTAVIAANAKAGGKPSARLARGVVATLRTRPPDSKG